MRYQFAHHLLMRSPVGDPQDYTKGLQYFLDDHFFRSALYLSSPFFYASLERKEFKEKLLSTKERTTLHKYVNRYCFRPTPFGLFASITLMEWTDQALITTDEKVYTATIRADMGHQNDLDHFIRENHLSVKPLYYSNTSLYRVLNEYRFFRTGLDDQGTQRDFQLQSIAFSKVLKDLITFCSIPRTAAAIADEIRSLAGCDSYEAEDYTSFLIDAQLLTCSGGLNITGQDFLDRTLNTITQSKFKRRLAGMLKQMDELHDGRLLSDPSALINISSGLNALIPQENHIQATYSRISAILQNRIENNGLNSGLQAELRQALSVLSLFSTGEKPAAMVTFIQKYQQHFEGRTIPLLLALDPEAGIGYEELVQDSNNPLLETLNIQGKRATTQHHTWTSVHRCLLETWLKSPSGVQSIGLSEENLKSLRKENTELQTLGFSVLFRKIDDQLFIENAGGINAPALMGRFTIADPAIRDAAREMAGKLAQDNPDVIFAELLHLADPHTDNVNRRESIYSYELPLTAPSLLPEEQQLSLSDLHLFIADNKVWLFSEKHQKVVIPRLTSAYNHSLNRLPLFRFLADLPYQYGQSNFSFDLSVYFPGLQFYPRVEYRGTILSLATWVITGDQLQLLRANDGDVLLSNFRSVSASISLATIFSLSEGDQELVFNATLESDILFFGACIRQKKEVILKELPVQAEVRQFNAYLLPSEPLILPELRAMQSDKRIKRKYVPGSEWLYLKIYTPRVGANRLLLRLLPLLRKRYSNGRINRWFFIRYEDHAPHIRLRLKVTAGDIGEILIAFKAKLEGRIQQQVIREYQIEVYTRELERYAAGGMSETEQLFWASSELVAAYLQQRHPCGTHKFAIVTVHSMIAGYYHDLDKQIGFAHESYQQFLPEFTDQSFKVALDKKYRELSTGINKSFALKDPSFLSGSVKAAIKFKQSLTDIYLNLHNEEESADSYLGSIIHMHFNRIFTDESRKQEMICYYLLYKYLLSVKGRSKIKLS